MTNCPCCSDHLLRCIREHELHYFCRTCWQEMPVLSEAPCTHSENVIKIPITLFHQQERAGCYGLPSKRNVARKTLISA